MTDFWRGKRVLVAGGSGFVGSHLVERLVEAGARVTATASTEPTLRRFLAPVLDRVTAAVGDLCDLAHARRTLRGHDVGMHLAARVGGVAYNVAHPASLFRDNLQPFLSVMEAARLESTPRLLVTSSACVYPRDASVPTPEGEGFLGVPEATNDGYGWAKRMEEFVADAYAREFGLDVCVARPVNTYGPRDDFDPRTGHVVPALIRRVLGGETPLRVWGDGTATRSFLYVDDLVRGLMAVVERARQREAINIATDEEVSIADLARLVVRLAGRDVPIEFDAARPSGQPRRLCDTTCARTRLGFKAEVPLGEGVARTIAWYRAHAAPVAQTSARP
jgi:GDP-L-fucose synthase